MASEAGTLPFDTAIGRCAVAWGPRGITRVWLLGGERVPVAGEPPATVRGAIEGMRGLLAGEPRDLRDVVLDLGEVSLFDRAVYGIVREVGAGETITYGEIATRLGDRGVAQAVGQAMGRNPCPIVVPCHRVLAAGGAVGGFSAPGGTATKERLLRIEGALAPEPLSLF
jgi:methylated-DNA-[protein]-cysteine S-methyltransferase